jgi:hypothetical protein
VSFPTLPAATVVPEANGAAGVPKVSFAMIWPTTFTVSVLVQRWAYINPVVVSDSQMV